MSPPDCWRAGVADLLDQAHANAGLNLLTADTDLTVHDGRVPDGAEPPYVLVYTVIDWPEVSDGHALDSLDESVTVRWYCHCVGRTAAAARAVAMRVRAALLNQRPTVTGRTAGIIRQESTLPPTRDESTGRLVMDAVAVYRLDTRPA